MESEMISYDGMKRENRPCQLRGKNFKVTLLQSANSSSLACLDSTVVGVSFADTLVLNFSSFART